MPSHGEEGGQVHSAARPYVPTLSRVRPIRSHDGAPQTDCQPVCETRCVRYEFGFLDLRISVLCAMCRRGPADRFLQVVLIFKDLLRRYFSCMSHVEELGLAGSSDAKRSKNALSSTD